MAELKVDIRVRAGAFALDAAFEADHGITAIFGRSGAGKSTLLRAIAGLLRPERALVSIGGRALDDTAHGIRVPARDRRIGFVFQDDRLFPHMSVRRNMAYGARPGEADSGFEQVVALLGLADLLDRMPATLSGGERKRVAIARALVTRPSVLLADEPTGNLDSARGREIIELLTRLNFERGITIVMITHELELARTAPRVISFRDGRIVADRRSRELSA